MAVQRDEANEAHPSSAGFPSPEPVSFCCPFAVTATLTENEGSTAMLGHPERQSKGLTVGPFPLPFLLQHPQAHTDFS